MMNTRTNDVVELAKSDHIAAMMAVHRLAIDGEWHKIDSILWRFCFPHHNQDILANSVVGIMFATSRVAHRLRFRDTFLRACKQALRDRGWAEHDIEVKFSGL